MSEKPKGRTEKQRGQSHGMQESSKMSAQLFSSTMESKRQLESESFELRSVSTDHAAISHVATGTKKVKISVANDDKLAPVNQAAAIGDNDSDSDVEFLFTLPSEPNECASKSKPTGSPQSEPEACASKDTPEDTEMNSMPSYTHASSAYVQNLAEICYTIMHDARWRTMDSNPLFRWEQGDDLSIVKELSRYYEGNVKTGCGLCRCSERFETAVEFHKAMKQSEAWPDPDEARAIHLYCRLYYRKGPWFRIDDIYKRYYAHGAKRASGEVDRSTDAGMKENTQQGNSPEQQSLRHDKKNSNLLFVNSSQKHRLDGHKSGIDSLIADLCWLVAAGYIRGFENEEECGKTVGGSLLRSDERTVVLSKLGAKTKTKGARSSSACNEIWTQMQQQKSLWSHFQPRNAKQSSLLPVRKHVDEIIYQQVTKCVMQSHITVEHTRTMMLRTLGDDVLRYVREEFRRSSKESRIEQISGLTCIRLREAPLKTLKRAVRLYLCATEGPGQMRGDGTNGWYSIEARSSLSDLPLSPSIDVNWNRINYPGLMVRFGRATALFSKAFQPINAELCTDHKSAEQVSSLRIFDSIEAFQTWEVTAELRANVDYLIELNEMIRYNKRKLDRGDRIALALPSLTDTDVDFTGVSDKKVRRNVVLKFSQACRVSDQRAEDTLLKIEQDVYESLPLVKLCCERVLHTIGVTCLHLLCLRHASITTTDLDRITQRPWLRHLTWESCLASLLWDIHPYFERNSCYRLAVLSLQTLVFGKADKKLTLDYPEAPSPLALHLISRRARGKAFDRIVIDFTHFTRKVTSLKDENEKTSPHLSGKVICFTNAVIRDASSSSSISFGSIRILARRLRCPLSETIAHLIPMEASELGLRLDNDDIEASSKKGYRDWSPLTDRSVANAIISEQSNSGRCAFVGHEDGGVVSQAASSMNVEELAIESYRSGRLPIQSDDAAIIGGGFHGWHDEGGRVRALFRILCSRTVLGMNWGEASVMMNLNPSCDHYTIHLSPYQGAPFDLHVGHGTQANATSFYSRRVKQIGSFLSRLQKLTCQEIADLVYDEVKARWDWSVQHKTNDPQLIRDLVQLRTLSALAAGLGGMQLASIFRCLFFDYRYYSGGLPDLLLFRAVYEDSRRLEMVELSEWIGEEFSKDRQATIAEKIGASFLLDHDDEFLGCSKTGDSAGQGIQSTRQGRGILEKLDSIDPLRMSPSQDMLPERLILSHGSRKVKIDCLMVEVKSANDRLDPRQEDWLNILDRHGKARVCKFEKSSKARKTEVNVDPKCEE
jgi:hypothetical protein